MNLNRFYPPHWFNTEGGDKAPAVRQRGESSRDAFRSEVDRLFENFFAPFGVSFVSPLVGGAVDENVLLRPSLDLGASEKEYTVSVELPGVDEKDVSIEVSKGLLTISGEKKKESDEADKKGGRHVERSYGFFQRALSLPEDADSDNIKASFDKGVLRVAIPRVEVKKDTRKVEITRG